jgi:16S rRNA (guanine1207-N2)-methyltransferase
VDGTTPGHYFERDPAVASRRRTVTLTLPDLTIDFTTDSGVFSGDGIDQGTKLLLLEAPAPPATGDLLDLGCGYGPIAITLARRSPAATVWAVDVNERAVALCAENATSVGLTNVRAVPVEAAGPSDDAVPAEVQFAGIYSNPPIRIGKAALHSLLRTWLGRLAPGGVAYLVIQKHLGSDSLARWLESEGWPTSRLLSRAGYRILAVTAPGRT